MKRFWLIALPVLAVTLFATIAYTKPEPPERPERPERKAMEEVFALAGSGYRLGVVLSEISPHLRDDLKISSGVMVEEVLSNSAAEKAGLKDGDIIVKLDGKEVNSQSDIRRALRDMEDPKPMTMDVLRDGKPLQITITPEKREMNLLSFGDRSYIGVDLQELDSDLSAYFQTKAGAGVLVTNVEPDSPAQKAGLKSGDVITDFDGKKIASADDLRDAVKNVKEGSAASLTVVRHGKQQSLTITPEKRQLQHFGKLQELQNLPELERLGELSDVPEIPELPEFRNSMRGLREDMQKLKEEMRELHLQEKDMQNLKEEIEKEMSKFRDEMKSFRRSD